ncbi:MAG: hypothetical protein KJ650_00800 [Firmicutes bacterium]|nr:hypothetical protein [Bacillota bacterium]MBV1727309.1 hypothetical protein [Desulforudis sp.]MBV1736418.1 hypothetical protein [Desulforudis sp.]MBV1770605.1 hypothetical protein [Desulforudis sp.]
MTQLLFETARGATAYRAILTGDGHFLIQEAQAGRRKSFRINGSILNAIRIAEDPFAAAADAYHQARLQKQARKRVTGGTGGDR